jgi:site-specific DNA-cytosine methylase
LDTVRRSLGRDGRALDDLAASVDMPAATIEAHLGGTRRPTQHAIDRYSEWLAPNPTVTNGQRQFEFAGSRRSVDMDALLPPDQCPSSPWNVVDLFAGCGGLSLGFDLHAGGSCFRTVLAMDIEQPMIDVFNANAHGRPVAEHGVAQRVDVEQFSTDAEILAYYLDHVASLRDDKSLRSALESLPAGSLGDFTDRIRTLDATFRQQLRALRATEEWRSACQEAPPNTFSQTSIEEFHRRIQLPLVGNRWVDHPVLWTGTPAARTPTRGRISEGALTKAEAAWDSAIQRLAFRTTSTRNALPAKARSKITTFLTLVQTPAFQRARELWTNWWARRWALRHRFFEEHAGAMLEALRELYDDEYRAHVILGGPPCQGFSRVGRGKLRSLRDQGAHVQEDEQAGDERNLLLYKYVQFVSALEPKVFLFENVAAFKSRVQTKHGSFDAVTTLEQAFDEISDHRVRYEVAMHTLQCAEHGIPQSRERFFMAGILANGSEDETAQADAERCLQLVRQDSEVSLKVALSGLPEATLVQGSRRDSDLGSACTVRREGPEGFDLARAYLDWIQRPLDGSSARRIVSWEADAHVARRPRRDDRAWFQRMGPGMRWMDYRCDDAATLQLLQEAIGSLVGIASAAGDRKSIPRWLRESLDGLKGRLDASGVALDDLAKRIDGSLSIRLLLEALATERSGKSHHLLRTVYLSKKGGHHGDWLKRLDPDSPCRTIVSHMAKDTYPFVHPSRARTLSVREAARVQTFPDAFSFSKVGMFYAYRMIGNAVPPLLSSHLARQVARVLNTRSRAVAPAAS